MDCRGVISLVKGWNYPVATNLTDQLPSPSITPPQKQLWKKHYEVNGMVSQHLSPFEQNIVSPMFKDVHTKVFKKLYEMALEAGPGLAAGVIVYNWAESTHKSIAFHHRH